MKTPSATFLILLLAHNAFTAWENLSLPKPIKKDKHRKLFVALKEMAASVIGSDEEFQKEKKVLDKQIWAEEARIFDKKKENQVKKSKVKERLDLIKSKMSGLSSVVKTSIQDLQTIIKFQENQKAAEKGGDRI